jgi:hypothetical protein
LSNLISESVMLSSAWYLSGGTMNVVSLLIDMEYLNRGLIPWSHYNSNDDEKNSLNDRLSEMTPEEQRVTKRKFRKFLRSELRRSRSRINKKSYWSRQYAVYHAIGDLARAKFKDLRDNDT